MAKESLMVFSLLVVLFVAFQLPFTFSAVVASGPIFIREDGSIEPISAPLQRNGNIYTLTDNVASFLDGIVVEKDNITLDGAGHTVQGIVNSSISPTPENTGINLTGRSNMTIENTIVAGFANGIMLSSSSNALGGISNSNIIFENNLTDNGIGINLIYSNSNFVHTNNITGNVYGIIVSSFSNGSTIDENSLIDNGLGIYLTSSDQNTVHANSISSTNDGIRLDSSSNNSVTLNSLSSNGGYGVVLFNSSNYNLITENNITNSDEGLSLRTNSGNNNIIDNNIEGNFRGLEFLDSTNDTIARNNITDSGWFNFRLLRCYDNVVYENTIERSYYTVWLDSSSNNSFYHNFMGSLGVYLAPSTHSNVWDDGYPSGGNYWVGSNVTDQYSGIYQNVAGSDGICDLPVVLDANDTDRYPLAGPFYSFNATSEQHVQMVSNSTITDFQFNGTALLFKMIGVDGTTGFCQIRIPIDLMNGTLGVFANGTQIPYTLITYANGTLSYLYFSLHFSTQQMTVIPEDFSTEMLFVSMLIATLTVLIYRKRHQRQNINRVFRQPIS